MPQPPLSYVSWLSLGGMHPMVSQTVLRYQTPYLDMVAGIRYLSSVSYLSGLDIIRDRVRVSDTILL